MDNGYIFQNTNIELYEANIPPLLRFFHIREVSPSGWIAMPIKKTVEITGSNKTTSCDYEYVVNYKNITTIQQVYNKIEQILLSNKY